MDKIELSKTRREIEKLDREIKELTEENEFIDNRWGKQISQLESEV